eukprot:210589_1
MDVQNHPHPNNNRQLPISKSELFAKWILYSSECFGDLRAYKQKHYNENQIHSSYIRWFKTSKNRRSVIRKIEEFRTRIHLDMQTIFTKKAAKDIPIRHTESIGAWWCRLQDRVLSVYMTKKAVKNKHKKAKTNKPQDSTTRKRSRGSSRINSNSEPPTKKRKVISISAIPTRLSPKKKSPFTPEYIERFAVIQPQTKIPVCSFNKVTSKVNDLQFDVQSISEKDANSISSPKKDAATHMILIYKQYMIDQLHHQFGLSYASVPKAWMFDTGSLRVRQKQSIYNTILIWNIQQPLIPKTEFRDKGCKNMTFTYRCSIGHFNKDCKKGHVYAAQFASDIRKIRLYGIDLITSDGETALLTVPKHIRSSKYDNFREEFKIC